MNLNEFISETLVSIIEGVNEAQNKAANIGALVNPGGLTRNISNIENNTIWDQTTNNYAQPVSFDIAITAEDSAKGGAKVKVLSGIFNGELGGGKENKKGIVSRVQFTVPILLPPQDINNPKARIQSTTDAISKKNK